MSTERATSGIRVSRPVGSVRIAVATAKERAAAEEHARIAAEEARWTRIREETLETTRRQWSEHFEGALRELAGERELLRTARAEMLEQMEPHVVELSMAIARKLVAQEIEAGQVDILPIVETVLHELREPDAPAVVAVDLSPEDYAALGAEGGMSRVAGVQITADASVARGACIVTTDAGRILSDLDDRIRSVRRALRLPVDADAVSETRSDIEVTA